MRFVLKRAWGRLPEPIKLGRSYRRTMRLLATTEAWTPDDWERYRLEKLRAILRWAGARVPHYRELFARTGFDPRGLASAADLAVLPTVDKAQLQAEKPRFVAELDRGTRVMDLATGGTTGVPHSFPYLRALYNQESAFIHHMWSRVGYVPGERIIMLRARAGAERSPFTFDPRWNARVLSVQHLNSGNVSAYRDRMVAFGARYLLSYPSSAAWFYGLLQEKGLDPPILNAMLLASERITAPQRRFLETYGQTRVFTWYGHTERLILAGECEESPCYHEEPAYGYLELVDESGKTITEPGRMGEMVGTTFDNLAFPFIRFRTGDWGAWHDQPCACGRPHRILGRVEGRWGNEYLLAVDGAHISVSALNLHGDQYEKVRNFQYVQRAPGRATVRIVPGAGYAAQDTNRLVAALASVTGSRLTWDAELVDRIDPAGSGKHQIVVHPTGTTATPHTGR